MPLPHDYQCIVDDAARLLIYVAEALREVADADHEKPELWLNVRELTGLGQRLCSTEEWEWRRGFGASWIVGQDFGVLDELMSLHAPYMTVITPLTEDQMAILERARCFLQSYHDRVFVREDQEPGA
ncbi:MAG: hypothetical protein ACJ796_05900 [Gemmatimonadaceae bacterium]